MNEGLEKFKELLLTDEAFQEKLKTAVENYDGEKTEEAIFHGVIEPVAAEYGITATFDEYKEYMNSLNDEELSKDELTQIAGGKLEGIGLGYQSCRVVGLGVQIGGSEGGGGVCTLLGYGWGDTVCCGEGYEGTDIADRIL